MLRKNHFKLTSSSPITPAPIRTIFSGTLASFKAPVDETITSSSISMPEKGVTSEPVAIRIFFVRTVSTTLPSSPRTETSFGPVIFPCP